MGTLAALIPILGLPAGIIVAILAKSEIKQGTRYFQLSQHILLGCTAGALALDFGYATATAAGAFVFAILFYTKFTHPVEFIPMLAVPAVLSQISQIPIFLYLIPTATLNRTRKLIVISLLYALIAVTASMPF